jgi:hypothetical protein
MSSTTEGTRAPITVHGLARLVEDLHDAARAVSGALAADPSLLAEVPDELLEAFTLALHSTADATAAAATVVNGRLERQIGSVRGKLIAGRYASTSRFLQGEAGMSAPQPRAAVARGRDLDTHSTRVADAWLAGAVPGGAVRDLTVGVTDVLRRSSRTDTPIARAEALDRLLPLAERGDTDRLHRAVQELRLRIDPDGTTEEALFAFESQTLSIAEAGSMFRVGGWLSPEAAAATALVLDTLGRQIADQQLGDVVHDPDCESLAVAAEQCSCDAEARARRAAGLRPDQLRALALGELMTDRLADAELGSHHRVAPHLTVIAELTDAAGPVIGRLQRSGTDDETLLGERTVDRLLCDADVTRVLTTAPLPAATVDTAARSGAVGMADPVDTYLAAVTTTLASMARSVLYVGRSERTVSARLRRALETRDGHCVFPGCRARVARCHAHHVLPWQHGGTTALPNLALVCITHHVALHEGGWTMALAPGSTGHEQSCWTFTAPLWGRTRRLRR